jgi:hypothetical protein
MNRFIPTSHIGLEVEKMVQVSGGQRKPFERRWYNNNFFDDGFHYRFVSRTTGKVVDLSTTQDNFIPYRAIPKSSRQIRGIANLLTTNEPTPVIYPEKVLRSNYPDPETYQMAMQEAKTTAKKVGHWLEEEWRNQDLKNLLTQMVILTAKHGVSYLQVWPDSINEKIKTQVYDAFDIYLKGNLTSIYDSPFIIKATPRLVDEIKSDENFDQEQILKLNPDNKYASSEIKEAYMMSRFGNQMNLDQNVTLIQKEAFLKEYINDENMEKVAKDLGEDFRDKKKGDPIIRQVFEAGGVWLKDSYLNLPEYPIVDFRMEPGPIYQVPLIERFIPANKSLDSVMSRIERHIGTMAVGAYMKRKGENYKITNQAGGQEIEYDIAPPTQLQMAPLPAHVFNFISQLNSIIEEQGASTAALGNVPQGVKSGIAIESLKATEYANLKIATDQLKLTVKRISEKMIDIAANYFIKPQTVFLLEQGEPQYFDVIGEKGLQAYEKINKKGMAQMPDAVPLKKDYRVNIEIESGMGYTEEGKRQTMIQIMDYMRGLAAEGFLTPESVAIVVKRFLEIFQYGSTQEFMDALDSGTPPVTDAQIQQMKVAMMEVIKDLQMKATPQPPAQSVGTEVPVASGEDQNIMKMKEGMLSSLSDVQGAQV